MDRIRDLASRKRASFPSFSIPSSFSQRKVDEDDAKSSTSSASAASEPLNTNTNTAMSPHFGTQPTEPTEPTVSSQNTVKTEAGEAQAKSQAQAESASDTEVSKPKQKKKKKGNKAALKSASMERLEAQEKLFEMAEAVIKQNETIASSGLAVSRRMNELARDVLEANQLIEIKDREIAEVNEKIWIMDAKYKEAEKLLNNLMLFVSETINGDSAQARSVKMMDLINKVGTMIRDIKMEKISDWSRDETNNKLKILENSYHENEESGGSDVISAGIQFSAKQLLFHGVYDDEYAPMVFHLANGSDYKAFLDRSREEDHEEASRPVQYRARQTGSQSVEKSAADEAKNEPCIRNFGTGGHGDGIQGSATADLTPDVSSGLEDKGNKKACNTNGCHCWMIDFVTLVEWVCTLRAALICHHGISDDIPWEPFFDAMAVVYKATQGAGVEMTMTKSVKKDAWIPAIQFIFHKNGRFITNQVIAKKLQRTAMQLGFELETCEHDGRAGCQILPKAMGDEDYLGYSNRIEMERVLREVVDNHVDNNTKGLEGLHESYGDGLRIELQYHASDYLAEKVYDLMRICGCTLQTCSTIQIRNCAEICVSGAKYMMEDLKDEHERQLQRDRRKEKIREKKKANKKKAAQKKKEKKAQEEKAQEEKKAAQETDVPSAK